MSQLSLSARVYHPEISLYDCRFSRTRRDSIRVPNRGAAISPEVNDGVKFYVVMDGIMLGYILVLISAISLGITNFVFPRASQSLGAVNATFFYYVFALLLALGYWIPLREHYPIKLAD